MPKIFSNDDVCYYYQVSTSFYASFFALLSSGLAKISSFSSSSLSFLKKISKKTSLQKFFFHFAITVDTIVVVYQCSIYRMKLVAEKTWL